MDPATPVNSHRAVLFGDGDTFAVKAGSDGMRFVLCAGRALHELIAWGGPVVMNTQEELDQAFDEIDKGTFVREGGAERISGATATPAD